MSTFTIASSNLGGPLNELLICPEIKPGDEPSYAICKAIVAFHPLGAKLTDTPVALAQSQERVITVQDGPEDLLVEAFRREWAAVGANGHLFNLGRQSRAYGICSMALLTDKTSPTTPLNKKTLWKQSIGFNVLDPLNTAGSLVLNQDPNSLDFQKVTGISIAGRPCHRSRSITLQNENPLYILWTSSAYGFTGRSVFQRALYPLKTFIRTMVTDDLVALKAGVIVAQMKGPGSIINQAMENIFGLKRDFIKEAATGNVLSIGEGEKIETLNFTNLEGPFKLARDNCLKNIATAADMPAILINQETFAEGFGEGTEDAKKVAQFVAGIRTWLQPAYDWMDDVVRHRAWNPEFYETVRRSHSDYANVPYETAFYRWTNSFKAFWPNLLEEPESEKIKVDDVKLKAVIAAFEVLEPVLDPENRVDLILWLQDCFNERKELFPSPLEFDPEALLNYTPPQAAFGQAMEEPKPSGPFSSRDSADGRQLRSERVSRAVAQLTEAVHNLPGLPRLPGQIRRLAA